MERVRDYFSDRTQALITLTGVSVMILLVSNIASVKITSFGPAVFDAGTILFPIVYILSSIITEVYGRRTSRMIVYTGLACLAIMSVVLLLVQSMPAGPGFEAQAAYERILGFVPRIVLGSLTAYFIGEMINISLMTKMRDKDGAQGLWRRLVVSSGTGELTDTIIFSTIAFAGTMPFGSFVQLIVTVYLMKLGFNIILSPVSLRIVASLKKLQS